MEYDSRRPPVSSHGGTQAVTGGVQIKEGNAPNRIYDWGLLDGSSINRVTQTMVTHAVDSEGAGAWQISNINILRVEEIGRLPYVDYCTITEAIFHSPLVISIKLTGNVIRARLRFVGFML